MSRTKDRTMAAVVRTIFPKKDWIVIKTIWPYPDGYGTYNKKTRTLLDSGLSKSEAQQACDQLNDRS